MLKWKWSNHNCKYPNLTNETLLNHVHEVIVFTKIKFQKLKIFSLFIYTIHILLMIQSGCWTEVWNSH